MSTRQSSSPEREVDLTFENEVSAGDRFEFGRNWSHFLRRLDQTRIAEAERSLKELLGVDLHGKTFLDIGCGSGLFSLAARRAGAHVTSFDFDPTSVNCATYLRDRFCPNDQNWKVLSGSILDDGFIQTLGKFDVVYSWGVLHHTGNMRAAIDNALTTVLPGGTFAIAIYNDQGIRSRLWRAVKRAYNKSGRAARSTIIALSLGVLWGPSVLKHSLRLRPLHVWRNYASSRGMSAWHDLIDWIGGYPFEVATPEQIKSWVEAPDISLRKLNATRGLGCNEFVFVRAGTSKTKLL